VTNLLETNPMEVLVAQVAWLTSTSYRQAFK